MKFVSEQPAVDLTYSDVFLVPRRSGITSRLEVDLAPRDGTPATIPLVASNMNSVTGPRLAAVLARRGGLAILPQDMPLQDLDAAIREVKRQPVAWDTPLVLPPSASVAEALCLIPATAGHGIVVAEGAAGTVVESSAVRGILPATRLATALPDAQLGDLVHAGTPALDAEDVTSPRAAFDVITETGAEVVTVVRHGHLVGTLSARSALRSTLYAPAVDADGRLAVGAAVGINGDVAAKARALAAAGVDVLVLDTAHGHQEGMLRALATVSALNLGIPLVAGNIVTADGANDLVDAGASILKVGVGPGAMCTTRMMTAVGRPQFSAVLETAQAAHEVGAHVWADGECATRVTSRSRSPPAQHPSWSALGSPGRSRPRASCRPMPMVGSTRNRGAWRRRRLCRRGSGGSMHMSERVRSSSPRASLRRRSISIRCVLALRICST